MDGFLKHNLDTAKKIITKDWDMLFAIDGAEGSGKSVFAMQMAYYCDNSFNIDRVVFTPKSFREAIQQAKPYQSVVYDEAYTGLSSRATMSLINRTLVKMLAEIRQKNLFILVVMPTFFDLDKYVALWRSRALVHIYTGKNFLRGFFAFFNVDRKKNLYVYGKKFYNYNKVKANFIGRFANYYVIDKEEYRKKKRGALVEREEKADQEAIKLEAQNQLFRNYINLEPRYKERVPNYIVAKLMGISEQWFYRKIKQIEDEAYEGV